MHYPNPNPRFFHRVRWRYRSIVRALSSSLDPSLVIALIAILAIALVSGEWNDALFSCTLEKGVMLAEDPQSLK